VAAQHNSRQHFDSADWAMSKASSSAGDGASAGGSRCQPSEALPSPLVASSAAAGASPAGTDRLLPSRFQRSPGADRALSRLSQS
jgi:hypothetical protein